MENTKEMNQAIQWMRQAQQQVSYLVSKNLEVPFSLATQAFGDEANETMIYKKYKLVYKPITSTTAGGKRTRKQRAKRRRHTRRH